MGRRRWDNEMKTRAEHPRIVQLTGELRQRRLRVIAVSGSYMAALCTGTSGVSRNKNPTEHN